MNKNKLLVLIGGIILIVTSGLLVKFGYDKFIDQEEKIVNSTPTITRNRVYYPQDYTFVLLGDSMTAALGNSDELKAYLTKYYPDKTFEFLNYGFGSTSLLSVEKRLTEETTYDRSYRPILDIDFDLILIESFGYNPLSQYPLNEGLRKQNEILDRVVKLIRDSNPKAAIVFVATVAPNSKRYGEGEVTLDPQQRLQWTTERTTYIKNHISYAQSHQIPVINIYEKSLKDGDGNLDYIEKSSFIHPSPSGVVFISREIADFLYQNKILDNIKKD